MKKVLLIGLVLTMMVSLLAGCQKAEETAPETSQAQEQTAAEDDLFIQVNGVKVYLEMKFEDIEDQLGEPTSPAQVILPCDGGDAYKGFIRIAFTMNEDRLREGLRRMAAFVESLKTH